MDRKMVALLLMCMTSCAYSMEAEIEMDYIVEVMDNTKNDPEGRAALIFGLASRCSGKMKVGYDQSVDYPGAIAAEDSRKNLVDQLSVINEHLAAAKKVANLRHELKFAERDEQRAFAQVRAMVEARKKHKMGHSGGEDQVVKSKL